MQIKYRHQSALLYRAQWVRKGEQDNTHGFTRATFVGSMPRDAQEIPERLADKLDATERSLVEQRLCEPARERARLELERARQHAADPSWRLREALGLIDAAIPLCEVQAVAPSLLEALRVALRRLPGQRIAALPASGEPEAQDPLEQAVGKVEQAAAAVREGLYGQAPKSNARGTAVYSSWERLQDAVQGDADDSLLRALQRRGFVKRKRAEPSEEA